MILYSVRLHTEVGQACRIKAVTPGLRTKFIVSEGKVADDFLWEGFVRSGLAKLAFESAEVHERHLAPETSSLLTLIALDGKEKKDNCVIPSCVCLSEYSPASRKRKNGVRETTFIEHKDECVASTVLLTVEQHEEDRGLLEVCDELSNEKWLPVDYYMKLCVFSRNVVHRVKRPVKGVRKCVVIFY